MQPKLPASDSGASKFLNGVALCSVKWNMWIELSGSSRGFHAGYAALAASESDVANCRTDPRGA